MQHLHLRASGSPLQVIIIKNNLNNIFKQLKATD